MKPLFNQDTHKYNCTFGLTSDCCWCCCILLIRTLSRLACCSNCIVCCTSGSIWKFSAGKVLK